MPFFQIKSGFSPTFKLANSYHTHTQTPLIRLSFKFNQECAVSCQGIDNDMNELLGDMLDLLERACY